MPDKESPRPLSSINQTRASSFKADLWPAPEWPEFILNHLPIAVLTVDSELRITYVNPAAEKLIGFTAGETMGRYCGQILRGGHCGQNCPLRCSLERTNETSLVETTIQTKNGEEVAVRLQTAAMFDPQGRLVGAVEAFSDIRDLKALETEKAQTLSLFAHDMKSPLVAVSGFLSRILAGKAGELSDKQREYLRVVREEISRVQALVLDFLDVARMESGHLELVAEPTDLKGLLNRLQEEYRELTQESGLRFYLEIEDSLPWINADRQRLGRVFTNLLDNAVKYADQGAVTMRARLLKPGRVLVEVEDEGPGLTEQDLAGLFQPFFRGQAARNAEGTGLGLAAVKGIVEAHGGAITAENRTEGGARFSVFLPVE